MAKGRVSRTGARKLLKKVMTPTESRNAIVREKVIQSLQKPLPPEDKPKRAKKKPSSPKKTNKPIKKKGKAQRKKATTKVIKSRGAR
jgi:hypothetical protein